MKTFKNFIAGAWTEPSTGEYFDNVNPADTRDVVGRFPLSGLDDVNRAVASARRGLPFLASSGTAGARGTVTEKCDPRPDLDFSPIR